MTEKNEADTPRMTPEPRPDGGAPTTVRLRGLGGEHTAASTARV